MSKYKVYLFNRAVSLPKDVNPPPPHPEIKKCASLDEARNLAREKSQTFEAIRIFSPDDDDSPVEEYRDGVRYVGGKKSPLE